MVYKWLISSLSRLGSPSCLLCDAALDDPENDSGFCPVCHADLPRFKHACPRCGNALPFATTQACGHCLAQHPAYDRVQAAFAYANPIRQLIARFKFARRLELGPMLANALLERLHENASQIEAILPVPLHQQRLRRRGYNQAVELARPLARALGLPMLLDAVVRHKATLEQSSLTGRQRRSNLKGAFRLEMPLAYRRLAIVDDVMTTGSTVHELATLLKNHGVEYIEVWCAARATTTGSG